jgi:hypothetical protein
MEEIPMPRLIIAILMLSVLSAGGATQAAPGTAGQRFEKYVGKYPSEFLKAEPEVKRRLQAILGTSYSFFMGRLQTEMPIEGYKGVLVTKGCKAHECGSELAIIFITLSDGKVHCAIRSDSYSNASKVKTFSEDPHHFPSAALKYALES